MKYKIDWREFLKVTGLFIFSMWCGLLVLGTFLYDKIPLWASALHLLAAVTTIGLLGSVKLKETT
jgi:hypothetical protein